MPLSQPSNAPVLQQFSLKGKVAAITGGSRGIGLEVARGLAEAGANVAIIYTSAKNAEESAEKLASETGVEARAYKSDVRDAAAIAETINKVAADFGHLDIVVANAGIATHDAALDVTPERFSELMKTNLDGAFFTAQAAAKIFKKQGHGNVIFTASVSSVLVNVPQTQAAYNASKAALTHLARGLAVEWVDFARVNCISPGYISTDMIDTLPKEWRDTWPSLIPGVRFCQPYELKGAYVFLASDASSYMTGANMIIDGGYSLL